MGRNLYYEDEILEEKFNGFMFKRLLSYAAEYKWDYIKAAILLSGAAFLSLVPTAINMKIINEVLPENGAVPENAGQRAVILLSLWITLSIGAVIADYFSSKTATIIGNSIVCKLREDLFTKLMELSFDYYDSRPTGKILVRITNYTDEIANFFINNLLRVIDRVLVMVIAIICICFVEIRMVVMGIVVSIPLVVLLWLVAKALHHYSRIDRNKMSNRTAFVTEDINGLEVIKAFNREALNDEIFIELSEKYHKAFMNTTRYRELFFPMSFAGVRILCSVAMYITALFIITNNIGAGFSLGALVVITTYMQHFSSAVYMICQQLQSVASITSNIERIFEVLGTESDIRDKDGAVELSVTGGAVEFKEVTFSYVEGLPVLENINISVEPGQMVALVGPTGAGKTTIASLLSRFYEIDSGRVLIDGTDIRDVTLSSLRGRVGVMMQDTFLFSGEIIENIRFSKPGATDEECMDAAKKVFAHDFIMKKKEGYHTVISSEGTELSAGEKQLLSFARLLLMNPDIIILDEATSNIDTETERLVQKLFTTVLKGKTCFIIAHRLSTIQNADRILYIDNKGIMEDGSHKELMQKKGMYYQLATARGRI
ncbi:MAG: ABC transporter ATP-binding protein/permease [Lachnospiraceae bacterium]|nr:ABC transporter ATP-binding protein/permease [Lachnospiraceae bacterium]